MVSVGLTVLSFTAWQFWGTNWDSRRHQSAWIESIRENWSEGRPTATKAKGVSDSRMTSEAIVRIPAFGASYAVPVLEGTGEDELASGFGHFRGSAARPGDLGNYALAAHRVTHGEPLRRMPELRPGDRIIVETLGRTYTYVLDTGGDDLVVPMTDTWIIAKAPRDPATGRLVVPTATSERLITLVTCSELFHTNNRMVAFGHLLSVVDHKAPPHDSSPVAPTDQEVRARGVIAES
jgi:sortase A